MFAMKWNPATGRMDVRRGVVLSTGYRHVWVDAEFYYGVVRSR